MTRGATRPRRCCGPTGGSCVARRPLRHRLRRGHVRGGHGRRRAGVPVGDRAQRGAGGAGDSSVLTALGVFHGMRAGALVRWGRRAWPGGPSASAASARSAGTSCRCSSSEGAAVVVADVDDGAVARVLAEHPGVRAVASTRGARWPSELDVYAPCALGHALTPEVARALRAGLVCGGANNQLATPGGRRAAGRARRPLLPRLLRQRRRRDPGGGRAARLLVRARPGADASGSTTRPSPCCARPPTRASRPPRPPTGSPSGGCANRRALPASTCLRARAGTGCERPAPIPASPAGGLGSRDASERPDVVPLLPRQTDDQNPGPRRGACPGSTYEGVDAMGRGRQKAKQTKVARELKYFSPGTDYDALQRELASGEPHPYAGVDGSAAADERRGRRVRRLVPGPRRALTPDVRRADRLDERRDLAARRGEVPARRGPSAAVSRGARRR